jgi:putative SOS response-associated peptidase YedK
MINARAETVAEKVSFKRSFQNKRCLVPVNGFFEWKKDGKFKKPFYIYLKEQALFSLAGIYEDVTLPDQTEVKSFAIITTSANKLMMPVHERMPVIIAREDRGLWLNPEVKEYTDLKHLLVGYPNEPMDMHEVSTIVNSPANNSPDCIKPIRTEE